MVLINASTSLIIEFVGLVSSGLSLKGYQFLRIGGEMHIVYQFGKEMPRVLMPDELG